MSQQRPPSSATETLLSLQRAPPNQETQGLLIHDKPPPKFQTLPEEVRTMIYEFMIPGRQTINLYPGAEQPWLFDHFQSLSKACPQIQEEVESWKRIPRIQKRLITTRWGLIDPEVTTFLLDIDETYRDHDARDEGTCNSLGQEWGFLRKSSDSSFIQNVILRFREQDLLTSPTISNYIVTSRVWELPNLRTLDIYMTNFGHNWGFNLRQFREIAQYVKDHSLPYFIPIGSHRAVQMHEYFRHSREYLDTTTPTLVFKMWNYRSLDGSSELLASYNDKLDNNKRGGILVEGEETAGKIRKIKKHNLIADVGSLADMNTIELLEEVYPGSSLRSVVSFQKLN